MEGAPGDSPRRVGWGFVWILCPSKIVGRGCDQRGEWASGKFETGIQRQDLRPGQCALHGEFHLSRSQCWRLEGGCISKYCQGVTKAECRLASMELCAGVRMGGEG